MPVIKLFNGSKYNFQHPINIINIAEKVGINFSKLCIAGIVNNKLVDAKEFIDYDAEINFITIKDLKSNNIIRQSCSQILGNAIKQLWPKSKMVGGKIIQNGFYYDFDLDQKLTNKDIKNIEKNMKDIVKKRIDFIKKIVSWNKARNIFTNLNEEYKIKIIDENINKKDKINLYFQEKYVDMSLKPNVPNTKFCNHFKLQKISGVYWKNNNKNKMLQRIYGTAWSDKLQLNNYLKFLEKAKNRDHRKINKNLDLYHIQENSPGMIFWHHNGLIIFNELKKFISDKLKKYNYQEIQTPLLINKEMWKKTGHWKYYKNSMFTTKSENYQFCIKPMNCPGHVEIFKNQLRSYKSLPLRIAEFGICHRNESSGSLHGLIRTRSFTQDDAHIFCTENQIKDEVNHCIKIIYNTYNTFGFKKILVKLSTRPIKRIGNDKIWNMAELSLEQSLKENNLDFKIQPQEGAFYGPKIEFILNDSLNRSWQCGTIQLDFSLPVLLNAKYIDINNEKKTPIMIHRAILGSIERFIGILIEEYSGNLPTWLSPIQIVIININDKQKEYAEKINNKLKKVGFRVKLDLRKEKISFKIREHTLLRIPYMIICGDKEMNSKKISVRTCDGNIFYFSNIKKFIDNLNKEICNKKIQKIKMEG